MVFSDRKRTNPKTNQESQIGSPERSRQLIQNFSSENRLQLITLFNLMNRERPQEAQKKSELMAKVHHEIENQKHLSKKLREQLAEMSPLIVALRMYTDLSISDCKREALQMTKEDSLWQKVKQEKTRENRVERNISDR